MGKYRKYIRKGKVEPLAKISFHHKAPIRRLKMLNKFMIPESKVHIAVHHINKLPKKVPKYCDLHKHNSDEINLILSEKGKMVYRIQFEDEVYKVSSPATIYVPKGIRHSAEVISGEGTFVCMVLQSVYKASK